MRKLIAGILFFFLIFSNAAYAIPKLSFSGGVSYDASSSTFSVNNGVLTPNFVDLSFTPELSGSTVDFSVIFDRPADLADLENTINIGGGNTVTVIDASFFGSNSGPDLTITADINNDNINETILEGNFVNFFIRGLGTVGSVSALIDVSAGVSDFVDSGYAEMLSLEFNLVNSHGLPLVFNKNLYEQDFTADILGDIRAVNEPMNPFLLLALTLSLMSFSRNYLKRNR